MAIRALGTIITDAIDFIRTKIPTLSLLTGTVARDVVVDAPAQEMGRIWVELDRIQRQQLLNDSTAFTDEELTNLAASYGIQRREGTGSSGTITFRLTSFSTSSTDIVIPAGTEVSTKSGVINPGTIGFTTTAARIFSAVNADSYFNPSTNFYEVTAPITAVNVGTTGNVGNGAITVLVTKIAGSPTVFNTLATSGGTEAETNAALLARVLTKVVGTAQGTVAGLKSLVNSDPSVVSSLILVPGDVELTRDEFGNAADVLIIGEIARSVTDTKTFTAGVTSYVFNRQPISSEANVSSVIVGVVNGLTFNFIEGTHYNIVMDTTTLTTGSVRATTKIVFLGAPFPDTASTFTIEYLVNGLVEDLQADVDADSAKIIGTDVLVREATKVLVRVGASITVLPGFTKVDVATAATDSVARLLNSSTLDSNIDQSDIIAAIQNTVGVDSVAVPISLQVKRPTDPDFIVTSSISTARTEYARPDSSTSAIIIT